MPKSLIIGVSAVLMLLVGYLLVWLLWSPARELDDQARANALTSAQQYCQDEYDNKEDCTALQLIRTDSNLASPTDGYNTYYGAFILYYKVPNVESDKDVIAVSLSSDGAVHYVTSSGYLEYPDCPNDLKLPYGQCKDQPKMQFNI